MSCLDGRTNPTVNANHQLDTLSPAIDKGNPEVIKQSFFDLHRDLIETTRPEDLPDIGAYEFINARPAYRMKGTIQMKGTVKMK